MISECIYILRKTKGTSYRNSISLFLTEDIQCLSMYNHKAKVNHD